MKKKLSIILILFTIVSMIVVLKDTLLMDTYLYDLVSLTINESFTKFVLLFTDIGSILFSFIVIIFVSIILYKYNKKKDLKWFLIILLIGNAVSFGFKLLFARSRPDILVLAIEKTYSFPSGHTFITTLLYGMILVLLNKYYKKKTIFNVIYIFLVLSIAYSRIYLGVHYFSDTLGGFLLGLFFLGIFYELVGCDKDEKKVVKRR